MKGNLNTHSGYAWDSAEHTCAHKYLMPKILGILSKIDNPKKTIFDLGCGNGSVAHQLDRLGYKVRGIDASKQGVRQANKAYPHLKIKWGSAYDDLRKKYGQFPVVISLEVVEHVFLPREYAKRLFDLVEPGGTAILSTPYHGYFKNLAIALINGMDRHLSPLWDYGHIKFWSVKTLSQLLIETGFSNNFEFYFVGRIPLLAKSMIVVAKKPQTTK
jgi:2-polyprenyl-3-methyl-5-hydroxy-6-metoxy-1,4-benzoquinol methylase